MSFFGNIHHVCIDQSMTLAFCGVYWPEEQYVSNLAELQGMAPQHNATTRDVNSSTCDRITLDACPRPAVGLQPDEPAMICSRCEIIRTSIGRPRCFCQP